ncbi:MAG: hypothetical protein GXO35_02030 [Gammaproteobacteria bacterium]|nr:hypothetical protein [Gammaproteobacteria bacterium]
MLRAGWLVFILLNSLPTASLAEEWDGLLNIQPSQVVEIKANNRLGKRHSYVGTGSRIEQFNHRIDQEVMILRAELAQENGEYHQVKNYVVALSNQSLFSGFSARLKALKRYLVIHKYKSYQSSSNSSSLTALNFKVNDPSSVVAIILPLTGPYEKVGNQLLDSLTQQLEAKGFKGALAVFDSHLYSSMFELWEVVKYYEPDFIFGPLTKSSVQVWHSLNTGVSTLYFNAIDMLYGYERSLSPNKQQGLAQVFSVLNAKRYLEVMVLTDQSEGAKKLESQFYQTLLSEGSVRTYSAVEIEAVVSGDIENLLNVSASKSRRYWLQSVIGEQVSFQPRARTDIEVIVSFLPESKGMQVTPILKFHGLDHIAHIWYPTKSPSHFFSKEDASIWQSTYVIMPDYIPVRTAQLKKETEESKKSGLFYALGQVAVDIANNSLISGGSNLSIETQYGRLVSNDAGQFYLLPSIFWVDKGLFKKLKEVADEG